MTTFLKVLVAAFAVSAAASNLAYAAGYTGYHRDDACFDHAYRHCR